ncbi:gastrula zinc finger protein XlCGF26.1-like [Ixodes scapularis]
MTMQGDLSTCVGPLLSKSGRQVVLSLRQQQLSMYQGHFKSTHGHRFQCTYCSYSTNYQTNLNNHVRVHTGERPFVCKYCNRTFSRNEHLKKHRCRVTQGAFSN